MRNKNDVLRMVDNVVDGMTVENGSLAIHITLYAIAEALLDIRDILDANRAETH